MGIGAGIGPAGHGGTGWMDDELKGSSESTGELMGEGYESCGLLWRLLSGDRVTGTCGQYKIAV